MDASSLDQIFESSDVVLACDSEEAVERLREFGLPCITVEAAAELPPANVILIGTKYFSYERQLGGRFRESRVLWVPAAAFDPSADAVYYTISRLIHTDFVATARRAKEWAERLQTVEGPFVFRGDGTELQCAVGDDIALGARLYPLIAVGEWLPAGAYFEVELEHVASDAPSFTIDGVLQAHGLLAARSFALPKEIAGKHDAARQMIRDLISRGDPIRLEIEHNRVAACLVGSEDVFSLISELTNEAYDGHLVEFAIGTNPGLEGVDWAVNSLMNEGLEGIHVALGDGLSGAHIDFIASGVIWEGA